MLMINDLEGGSLMEQGNLFVCCVAEAMRVVSGDYEDTCTFL